MEEELEAETLMGWCLDFVCPICLKRKELGAKSYFKACCVSDRTYAKRVRIDMKMSLKGNHWSILSRWIWVKDTTNIKNNTLVCIAELKDWIGRKTIDVWRNEVRISLYQHDSHEIIWALSVYSIADEGKDWAQLQLGCRYLDGCDGIDMNLPEGQQHAHMRLWRMRGDSIYICIYIYIYI